MTTTTTSPASTAACTASQRRVATGDGITPAARSAHCRERSIGVPHSGHAAACATPASEYPQTQQRSSSSVVANFANLQGVTAAFSAYSAFVCSACNKPPSSRDRARGTARQPAQHEYAEAAATAAHSSDRTCSS